MMKKRTRRELLAGTVAAGIAATLPSRAETPPVPAGDGRLKICIFSKHLQWLGWKEAGETAAKLGFDGVDLTVREGGHVLPERVESDLPKAVADIRAGGSSVAMITAGIVDTKSPHAETILRTAASLGIRHYRWGGFRYDYARPISAQLEELRPVVAQLAALNERYNVCAMYHTHSGPTQVGSSIWDLWTLLKNLDSRYVGVNFDIGHAVVEGGYGGWLNSSHLIAEKYLRGVALKDFKWAKNAKGEWTPQWCAIGEGMVDFPKFFSILRAARFDGPVQLHFEYPGLGGADAGKNKLSVPRETVLAAMKRDLEKVRAEIGD